MTKRLITLDQGRGRGVYRTQGLEKSLGQAALQGSGTSVSGKAVNTRCKLFKMTVIRNYLPHV